MKHTSLLALASAALVLAAGLLPAPAAAKTKHSHKMHTKKHTRKHVKMHTRRPAMTHRTTPGMSHSLTPAPGIGPARTGTGPDPTTGRVTGTVPSAVGDAGGQVNPPSPPAGGGVSR